MDGKTKAALEQVVNSVVNSYLMENPYGLFIVEVDNVPLCGPTLDPDELIVCMLDNDNADLFFMSGGVQEVTTIRFDFERVLTHRSGLENINDCIVSCSAPLENYVQQALSLK